MKKKRVECPKCNARYCCHKKENGDLNCHNCGFKSSGQKGFDGGKKKDQMTREVNVAHDNKHSNK